MLNPFDDRQLQAVRRLRLQDDFKEVVSYLGRQQDKITAHCTTATDKTRLRQFQGAAQTLQDLLDQLSRD